MFAASRGQVSRLDGARSMRRCVGVGQYPAAILNVSLPLQLCGMAQEWVNHLAHTGTLRHRGDPELGENLFCRNTALILRGRTSVMPDITGQFLAAALPDGGAVLGVIYAQRSARMMRVLAR